MSTKDEFVCTMHAKLDQWNAEIDALKAKPEAAEAEACAECHKQLETLRSELDGARSR